MIYHTSGQWKVTGGVDITLPNGHSFSVDGVGDTGEESEEIAQLIVSAPNMLKALEAIRARLHGEFDNPALIAIDALSTDLQSDLRYIVHVALAKAKGGKDHCETCNRELVEGPPGEFWCPANKNHRSA